VRLRYRQRPVACTLSAAADELWLAEPVLGVAPGQLACLMDGDAIVGHATIAEAGRTGACTRPGIGACTDPGVGTCSDPHK